MAFEQPIEKYKRAWGSLRSRLMGIESGYRRASKHLAAVHWPPQTETEFDKWHLEGRVLPVYDDADLGISSIYFKVIADISLDDIFRNIETRPSRAEIDVN